MGDVYAGAAVVVVWLGCEPQREENMRIVREWPSQADFWGLEVSSDTGIMGLRSPRKKVRISEDGETWSRFRRAARYFLDLPYWRRIRKVQEVVLSRQSVVTCGSILSTSTRSAQNEPFPSRRRRRQPLHPLLVALRTARSRTQNATLASPARLPAVRKQPACRQGIRAVWAGRAIRERNLGRRPRKGTAGSLLGCGPQVPRPLVPIQPHHERTGAAGPRPREQMAWRRGPEAGRAHGRLEELCRVSSDLRPPCYLLRDYSTRSVDGTCICERERPERQRLARRVLQNGIWDPVLGHRAQGASERGGDWPVSVVWCCEARTGADMAGLRHRLEVRADTLVREGGRHWAADVRCQAEYACAWNSRAFWPGEDREWKQYKFALRS